MNIHPIFVHFPIALWLIYCIILIIQLIRGRENAQLNIIKQFCLIAGSIGGIVSLQTGEGAKHLIGGSNLIEIHATIAAITADIFIIISFLTIYTLQSWTTKYSWDFKIKTMIDSVINHKAMAIIGVMGLMMLTLIGALGGAISRGTNKGDPVSDWAVKTFVGTITNKSTTTPSN